MKKLLCILMTAVMLSSMFVPMASAEIIVIDNVEHDSGEFTPAELEVYEQFRRYDGVIRFTTEELENLDKDYSTDAEDDVDVSNSIVDKLNIDDYYKNGWTDEVAGDYVKKGETVIISKYQLAIDLNLYLKTMVKDAEGNFNDTKDFTSEDLAVMVNRLNELTGVNVAYETNKAIVTDDIVADVLYQYLEAGYVTDTGVKYELSDGINPSDEEGLTREEAAKMLENLLNQTVYDVTLDKFIDGTNDTMSREEIKLMEVLGLGKIKGTVTANSVTKLKSSAKPSKGDVEIDNIKYDALSKNYDNFLGRIVDCYIYIDDDDEMSVVAMQANAKDSYISCEVRDITEMSASEITIDTEDDTESYELSSAVNVIFNGKYNGTLEGVGINKNFKGENPNKIAFITEYADSFAMGDSNNDGEYDVIFVNSYLSSKVTAKAGTIMTVDDYASQIDLDDYATVRVYKGINEVGDDSLAIGDVVSIAASGDLITIYISTKKVVSGKVSKLTDESVLVAGQEEEIYFAPYCVNDVMLGENGTFYISHFNKIVITEKGSTTGRNYGYMIEIAYDDFTEESKVRMYAMSGTTGEWKNFTLAEKIDFYDGASIADPGNENYQVPKRSVNRSELVSALQGTTQLISYDTNSNDEISMVETAMLITTGIRPEKVFRKEVVETRLRTYNGGWVGGVYAATADSKAYNIPPDRTYEKGYSYKSGAFNDGGILAGTEIYDATSLGYLGGVVLIFGNANPTISGTKTLAIADIDEAYDEAEEEVKLKITAHDGTVYTMTSDMEAYVAGGYGYVTDQQTKYTVSTAMDLQVGDLIGYETDPSNPNIITKFIFYVRLEKLDGTYFNHDTNGGRSTYADTGWWISYGIHYGKVIGADAAHNLIVANCGATYSWLPIFCRAATPVYIYDRSARSASTRFIKASSTDIMAGDDIVAYAGYYSVDPTVLIIK